MRNIELSSLAVAISLSLSVAVAAANLAPCGCHDQTIYSAVHMLSFAIPSHQVVPSSYIVTVDAHPKSVRSAVTVVILSCQNVDSVIFVAVPIFPFQLLSLTRVPSVSFKRFLVTRLEPAVALLEYIEAISASLKTLS